MYKTLFASALLASSAMAVAHEHKIADLIEGFFVGAFDFHGMTDITHCITEDSPVEEHYENAMRGFWNGAFQEVSVAI